MMCMTTNLEAAYIIWKKKFQTFSDWEEKRKYGYLLSLFIWVIYVTNILTIFYLELFFEFFQT